METICMKCQKLFSGKNKKNISRCYLLKILPSMKIKICKKQLSKNYVKNNNNSNKNKDRPKSLHYQLGLQCINLRRQLHEMSNPQILSSGKNKKKYPQFVICYISQESDKG